MPHTTPLKPHKTPFIPQTKPLVSVIVPVYNAERYLRYCVDSILGQSYPELEVILVDDGSTDASPAICDEYARSDIRVVVIHQSNGGISKAQNAGLDASHGDYIAFADNDDILDKRNIELLLHALESTGADMSKARWRQFGVSQLDQVAAEAAIGTDAPQTVTVFQEPLRAYQTVFCKSLRILGNLCGRHTEARYFNEANWCRLYRRELWDGLRFPEGMYAQDVMVAGELYLRMKKVADVDRVLYHWLQSGGSVTHSERSFGFYHDNMVAGITNFTLALEHGILPLRSYYTMVGALHDGAESLAPHNSTSHSLFSRDFASQSAQSHSTASRNKPEDTEQNTEQYEQYERDKATVTSLVRELTLPQRIRCEIFRRIRLCEKAVYDANIKNLQ